MSRSVTEQVAAIERVCPQIIIIIIIVIVVVVVFGIGHRYMYRLE